MTGTSKSSRRGAVKRKARARERQAISASPAIHAGMEGGQYQPLSAPDLAKIHVAALDILEHTGIGNPTDELLTLVLPKGASLNEHGRLCFPKALIEDVIAGAAREYTVHARGSRAGKDDMHCNGTHVYFSNSGSAVTTFDAESRS